MAIPKILRTVPTRPYPDARGLGPSMSAVSPARARHARYFIDAYDVVAEPMATALPNMVAIREACERADVPIVFTAQPGDQHLAAAISPTLGQRPVPGPTEIIDELVIREHNIKVTMALLSFQRTDMANLAHHGR